MAKCKDHLGNEYGSKKEMIEHYNIGMSTFYRRVKMGYDFKDIITIKPERIIINIKCKDHLGNEYDSKKEMCEHYNIDISTFYFRIKKRYSLENALMMKPRKSTTDIKCKDHLGNEYDSQKEMCEHYNINTRVFYSGIKMGLDLKKILTTKTKKYSQHIGEESITTVGQKMKIIALNWTKDITVEFEDGTIREHTQYSVFLRGNISNPNLDTGYERARIAYKLSDGSVYLYCKCRKCGKEYIGAWQDVYAHKC